MKAAVICVVVALAHFVAGALVDRVHQGQLFQVSPYPRNETRPDGSVVQVWQLDSTPASTNALLNDLFMNWWSNFSFGPLMPNVAYEVRAPNKALWIKDSGGWLMIQFGSWHMHFCTGTGKKECTASVELYRSMTRAFTPQGWGLRFASGDGTFGMYVFLPHPWYQGDNRLPNPDWSHLDMWYYLRRTYLGLDAEDPIDRTARPLSALAGRRSLASLALEDV